MTMGSKVLKVGAWKYLTKEPLKAFDKLKIHNYQTRPLMNEHLEHTPDQPNISKRINFSRSTNAAEIKGILKASSLGANNGQKTSNDSSI